MKSKGQKPKIELAFSEEGKEEELKEDSIEINDELSCSEELNDEESVAEVENTPKQADKTLKNKAKKSKSSKEPQVRESDVAEELIDQLLKLQPADDIVPCRNSLQQIDWDRIQIKNHSTDELKDLLNRMLAKIRKLRSLTEVLQDAKESLKTPRLCPDFPIKPPASFTLFIREKSQELKAKNNGKLPPDLLKKASVMYSELSAAEREAYVRRAKEMMDTYKEEVLKFEMEHPELKYAKPKVVKGKNVDLKPFRLFMEKNRNTFHPGLTGIAEARTAYIQLPIQERVKYIKQYLKQDSLRLFTDLSMSDRQVYLEYLGAPSKITSGGFGLFLKKHIGEFAHIPNVSDRWKEVSKKWRALTEDQKSKYRKKGAKKKTEFTSSWKVFTEDLDEFNRKLIAPTKRELKKIKQLRSERDNPKLALKNAKEKEEKSKKRKLKLDKKTLAKNSSQASSIYTDSEEEDSKPSPVESLYEELITSSKDKKKTGTETAKKRPFEDTEDSIVPKLKRERTKSTTEQEESSESIEKTPKKNKKDQVGHEIDFASEVPSSQTDSNRTKKKKNQEESEVKQEVFTLHLTPTKSPKKKKHKTLSEPSTSNEPNIEVTPPQSLTNQVKQSPQERVTEQTEASLFKIPSTQSNIEETPQKKKSKNVNGSIYAQPPILISDTETSTDTEKKKKRKKIPVIVIPEPELPPANIFTYYCHRKFDGDKEQARIKWKKLKESKKEKYKAQYSTVQQTYAEELKNYVLLLNDEERITYKKRVKALQKQNLLNAFESDSEYDSE